MGRSGWPIRLVCLISPLNWPDECCRDSRCKLHVPKYGTCDKLLRMRVNATSKLYEFSEKYPPARAWVSTWLAEVQHAQWTSLLDVQKRYPTARCDIDGLVIFEMKGLDFKLATYVSYSYGLVLVKWVRTRAECSGINVHKVKDGTRSR